MDTPRVLVAEDDPSVRKAVERVLELENYAVTSVGDGAAALEALTRHTPDLAVLDVMMPGTLDGFAMCKRIKADRRFTYREIAGPHMVMVTNPTGFTRTLLAAINPPAP